jgi:hypothetical protein
MKMQLINLVSFLLFITFLGCMGCNDERTSNLSSIIEEALNDNEVSEEEWEKLKSAIQNSKKNSSKYPSDSTIILLINQTAKNAKVPTTLPIKIWSEKERPSKVEYNIYIENSGSMIGYMNGNTDFKKALFDLITRFNGEKEKVTLNYINDHIYPIDTSMKEFIEFLEPKNVKKYGNTSSSELNRIFRLVVDKWKTDGKPAVLVSDYIYSIDKGGNIDAGLATQKYTTKLVFQEVKDDCAVLIIKSNSFFDGKYYTFKNPNSGEKINSNRPYYIWVIGGREDIIGFTDKYHINKLDGYENHVVIYNSESIANQYYTILPTTNKKGKFRRVRGSNGDAVKSIESIEYDKRKKPNSIFEFTVAIDFRGLPVNNDYIMDKSNYILRSSLRDDFKIVSITEDIQNVEKRDKGILGTASHIITISTTSITAGEQVLALELKKELPKWIETSSTVDDTDIEKNSNKTFGLSYLIEGVAEAYDPKGDESVYFSLKMNLSR